MERSQEQPEPRSLQLLRRSGQAALALLGVFAIVTVFSPFDLEYEGASIWPAMRLAAGQQIYGDRMLVENPWLFSCYGPAHYTLMAVPFSLLGPALWFGRLASLAFAALSATALFRFLHRRVGEASAWSALIVFVLNVAVWRYSTLMRVDMMGATCGLLALLLVAREVEQPSPKTLAFLAAGVLSLTAFATKITLIATSPAIALILLLRFRPKNILGFAAGLSIGVAFFAVVLSTTSNLGYVVNQNSVVGDFGLSLSRTLKHLREFSGQPMSVIGLCCGGMLSFDVLRFRAQTPLERGAVAYLICAAAIGLVGAAHSGSNVNHFMELAFAMSLATGLQLRRWSKEGLSWKPIAVVFPLAIAFQVLVFHSNTIRGRIVIPQQEHGALHSAVQTLKARLPAGSKVLSFRPEVALLAGHEPLFNDIYYYRGGPEHRRRLERLAIDDGVPDALLRRSPIEHPDYEAVALEPTNAALHLYLHVRF